MAKTEQEMFIEAVRQIVMAELKSQGMLNTTKKYGVVKEVLPYSYLMIEFYDSDILQKIRCNPDINFQVNDRVIVEFINGNSNDKFVTHRIPPTRQDAGFVYDNDGNLVFDENDEAVFIEYDY